VSLQPTSLRAAALSARVESGLFEGESAVSARGHTGWLWDHETVPLPYLGVGDLVI
jgi:hypothetical protein